MIASTASLKHVQSNSLFKSVPAEFLKTFIKTKNLLDVKEGTLFYSADDESREIYLILEGEVKIKFADQKNIEYRYQSDFFGEKEILDKTNRTSFVIANKDCKLYRIDEEDINSVLQGNEVILNNLKRIEAEELVESI
jgi:CRP-like cAMP-binding protein